MRRMRHLSGPPSSVCRRHDERLAQELPVRDRSPRPEQKGVELGKVERLAIVAGILDISIGPISVKGGRSHFLHVRAPVLGIRGLGDAIIVLDKNTIEDVGDEGRQGSLWLGSAGFSREPG